MSVLSCTPAENPGVPASSSSRLCVPAAMALFALGVLLAAHRIITFDQVVVRLDRKQQELAELEQLYSESLTVETARALWLRHHGSRPAAPLQEILPAALPANAAVEIQYRTPAAADPGWTCRRAGLAIRKAKVEAVVDLCRRLETASPPWRVTSMRIEASDRSAGIVDTTLELQTLVQTQAPMKSE